MKKRSAWIPVVTGLIKKDNKFLVGLRPEEKYLPNVWEFPGGKIENGESPEQALQRELKEELDIKADIGGIKLAVTHHYSEKAILLLFYEVIYWKGEPKPLYHKDLQWVTLDELSKVPLPEANKKILPLLTV